ncbi:MAG: CHAT domain protein [Syntrophus sp. PtaB.Bin001]|nr:MAG: CHAT domain protein [Syntrophus sp. PtaB.Bin001]
MSEIRKIKLEILRPGPAHNQLLSPLTPYIALCGGEGPVTINFPFEHRQLLTRLERLRYISGAEKISKSQREAEIRELGELIGDVLGKVPALVYEIGHARGKGRALIHLRLSLSASELGLVPFEAAIGPNGFPVSGAPLFLQTTVPITLTREVRRGRPLEVFWNRPPRILFAFAGPPSFAAVPFQEHLEALRRAVAPYVKWQPTPEGRVKEVKKIITVLPNATLDSLRDACEKTEFTHIHILAHGAPFTYGGQSRYGLALFSDLDPHDVDIVDGERLALTLTATDSSGVALHRPTLVSLATCDSGNVGSVIAPGGSIAHELHAGGIPWVIASQFPLWMRGSCIAAEVLYASLLRGDDPRWALYDLRQHLRTDSSNTHDWASIVVYASVPWNFERQVDAFHDRQFSKMLEVKFDKAEQLFGALRIRTGVSDGSGTRQADEVEAIYTGIRDELKRWLDDMPSFAPAWQRAARIGKRAASEKRIAILYHRQELEKERLIETASIPVPPKARKEYLSAQEDYHKALETEPHNHWFLTQYLSLGAILSEQNEAAAESLAEKYRSWWFTARQLAEWDLSKADVEKKPGPTAAWRNWNCLVPFTTGMNSI